MALKDWFWFTRSSAPAATSAAPTPQAIDEALTQAAQVLTPEELYELITLATAEKKADLVEQAQEAAEEQAEAKERAKRAAEPLAYVGILDAEGVVSYVKLKQPLWQHERTIKIHTTTYEHVTEDAEDVWIYRHMD